MQKSKKRTFHASPAVSCLTFFALLFFKELKHWIKGPKPSKNIRTEPGVCTMEI